MGRPFLAILVVIAVGLISPSMSFAQLTPPQRGLVASDLRRVETRVMELLPQLQAATVAVQLPRGGAGAGVIVNNTGLVLTAGHVSGTPGQIAEIILADGRRLRGKTLGRNGVEDSGMIQIETDKTDFAFVTPGKSSLLEAGNWVIALGHPGGYRKDRAAVLRVGRVVRQNIFIQTDAVLVGGDSGGPLFDLDGQLVGIHSRIGASIADNRHVPIDKYTATWERLAAGEDWNPAGQAMAWMQNQPWLGVDGEEDPAGYRVTVVEQSGPANKAGLTPGDVITAFAGKELGKDAGARRALHTLLGSCRIGDVVDIEVIRDSGETVRLPVKLARRPTSPAR